LDHPGGAENLAVIGGGVLAAAIGMVDQAADHPITSCVNDWVLVHVGFAMSRIDEAQAAETLKILTELGEAQAEMKTIFESTKQALG
jgi:hydrogenase assembly chaperone HypC/HupF